MFNQEAQQWLAQAIGSAPEHLDIRRMQGSTSSSVFLVQDKEATKWFVLRVLDNEEWLAHEPDLIEHEAAALLEVQKFGFRAPGLITYTSQDVGFGFPALVMSFVEGQIDLHPANFQTWLENLAQELAVIHQHKSPSFGWNYRSWVNHASLAVPDWTALPQLWEQAIERVLAPAPSFHPVFIHRDYHPMNVLWRDGIVSGVVDWINACQGPAGVDVAHCRSNLVLMYGIAAADQFLSSYCHMADGFTYDPYWDLESILDMGLPEPFFYTPWQEFGLEIPSATSLQQRVDAYLEQVLLKVNHLSDEDAAAYLANSNDA